MEPEAFIALVATLRPKLIRYAATIVGRGRAEDAVQTALASAWAHVHAGREVIDGSAFLFGCVRNSAINVLRLASARHDARLPDRLPAPQNVALEVEQRDELRRTLAAIADLPANQRSALSAAAGGQTPRAIAAGMGVTGGAVRILLHRARTTVRASKPT